MLNQQRKRNPITDLPNVPSFRWMENGWEAKKEIKVKNTNRENTSLAERKQKSAAIVKLTTKTARTSEERGHPNAVSQSVSTAVAWYVCACLAVFSQAKETEPFPRFSQPRENKSNFPSIHTQVIGWSLEKLQKRCRSKGSWKNIIGSCVCVLSYPEIARLDREKSAERKTTNLLSFIVGSFVKLATKRGGHWHHQWLGGYKNTPSR